jgi:hypothetical protein
MQGDLLKNLRATDPRREYQINTSAISIRLCSKRTSEF